MRHQVYASICRLKRLNTYFFPFYPNMNLRNFKYRYSTSQVIKCEVSCLLSVLLVTCYHPMAIVGWYTVSHQGAEYLGNTYLILAYQMSRSVLPRSRLELNNEMVTTTTTTSTTNTPH